MYGNMKIQCGIKSSFTRWPWVIHGSNYSKLTQYLVIYGICVCDHNEIMCNPANELLRKRSWRTSKESRKPEQGVKQSCDGEMRRNVPPELLLPPFSLWHSVCVGVSCWFKAPVMRRICKGPQATRRHASRIPTQQPPPLLTTLLTYWLPQPLSTPLWPPSVSALHRLSPPFTLTRLGLRDSISLSLYHATFLTPLSYPYFYPCPYLSVHTLFPPFYLCQWPFYSPWSQSLRKAPRTWRHDHNHEGC